MKRKDSCIKTPLNTVARRAVRVISIGFCGVALAGPLAATSSAGWGSGWENYSVHRNIQNCIAKGNQLKASGRITTYRCIRVPFGAYNLEVRYR